MCAEIQVETAVSKAHLLEQVRSKDVPYLWGFDDALEGLRPRPAAYFGVDSLQWQEYEAGYLAGIEHVFCLPSPSLRVALHSERPADLLVDEEDRHREQRY